LGTYTLATRTPPHDQPGLGVGFGVVGESGDHVVETHSTDDGHAVPATLTEVGALVPQRLERQGRKGSVGQLGLLHAEHVRLGLGDPFLDARETSLERIHIPGGDAHRLIVRPRRDGRYGRLDGSSAVA